MGNSLDNAGQHLTADECSDTGSVVSQEPKAVQHRSLRLSRKQTKRKEKDKEKSEHLPSIQLSSVEIRLVRKAWQIARREGPCEPGRRLLLAIFAKSPDIKDTFEKAQGHSGKEICDPFKLMSPRTSTSAPLPRRGDPRTMSFSVSKRQSQASPSSPSTPKRLGENRNFAATRGSSMRSPKHTASSTPTLPRRETTKGGQSDKLKLPGQDCGDDDSQRYASDSNLANQSFTAHAQAFTNVIDDVMDNLGQLNEVEERLYVLGSEHAKKLKFVHFDAQYWATFGEVMMEKTLFWGQGIPRHQRSSVALSAWCQIVMLIINKMREGFDATKRSTLRERVGSVRRVRPVQALGAVSRRASLTSAPNSPRKKQN